MVVVGVVVSVVVLVVLVLVVVGDVVELVVVTTAHGLVAPVPARPGGPVCTWFRSPQPQPGRVPSETFGELPSSAMESLEELSCMAAAP